MVTTNNTKSMEKFVQNNGNDNELTFKNHHIRKNRIISVNKLRAKELYSTLVSNVENKPTSQMYFWKIFPN